MKKTYISSTDLKNKTAEILNLVSFGGVEAIIERHGRPLAKILPFKEEEKRNLKENLKKYFGAIADFPQVVKNRYFKRKKIHL
jgi:prevent-host-death family protein